MVDNKFLCETKFLNAIRNFFQIFSLKMLINNIKWNPWFEISHFWHFLETGVERFFWDFSGTRIFWKSLVPGFSKILRLFIDLIKKMTFLKISCVHMSTFSKTSIFDKNVHVSIRFFEFLDLFLDLFAAKWVKKTLFHLKSHL